MNGPKLFRFKTMWLTHKEFPDIVITAWNQSNLCLNETIKNFQRELTQWNNITFKNIFSQKRKILARLSGVQKSLCTNNYNQMKNLEKKNYMRNTLTS